jgi:hypothetical protein
MRHLVKILAQTLVVALAVTSAPLALGEAAQPVSIRSVVVVPATPQEGRDPFFPDSTRTHEESGVSNRSAAISALVIRGFSGPQNHRLVIINNHTFGVGDEGDVKTSGGRVHLRCTEIRTNSIVIEISGMKRELNFTFK